MRAGIIIILWQYSRNSLPTRATKRNLIRYSKLEYPTQEEIDAEEAECAAMMENIAIARKAIMADVGESGLGQIICPVCKCGTLTYTVAMNGHVHAKCSKSGCVCWME